jgi:Putative polyhydroxyalkanoic acid system protein (PHA_gran_rgn)
VRVSVSHNKPKSEVLRAVDQVFDDVFRGTGTIPFRVVNEERKWEGDILRFSFTAKMGILSAPVKGSVEVTETQVTIDADLGLLGRLLSTRSATQAIEGRIRGLLR